MLDKKDIDRDRLSKLLGMLGCAHSGEIANAGRAAHAMIRAAGTTWPDLLRSASVIELDKLDRLRSVNARLRLEIEVLDSMVTRSRSDNARLRQENELCSSMQNDCALRTPSSSMRTRCSYHSMIRPFGMSRRTKTNKSQLAWRGGHFWTPTIG